MWNPNENHPKKGSTIKVEPIYKLEDIKRIKKLLKDRPRDLCLFEIGINTNLRASDILRIKVSHVKNLKPRDSFEITEKKTGKKRRITVNKTVVKSINKLLSTRLYEDDDPLFLGQRGLLTVPSVHRLVKSWCRKLNIDGNFGSHTLRKTFGYHQRATFNKDIAILMEIFNHSNQRQTLSYLCIQKEEIQDVYMNEL